MMAAQVTRAHREIPAVSIVDECDLSNVPRIGLSYLPWIVHAAARTLRELPHLNATMVDDELLLHDRIDIAIAVQTNDGLVMPVLRDADQLDVPQLAEEIRALTAAAREHQLRPEQLRDSTFSITAAGRRGGLFATPIINHPEVAILGVHRITSRPIVRRGQVVVGRVGCMSCTFDHRAVDGLAGGEFLQRVIRRVARSTVTKA
jgi:pyruvate dehydrogenase E2 component (dihydrolipoyllysine-residue acetyltransferase)